MNAKGRFILAALMSSVMVFMVTLLVTYLNLGLRADFLLKWGKAYVIAWPVAATMGFPGDAHGTTRNLPDPLHA
jgi:hypothetical protein